MSYSRLATIPSGKTVSIEDIPFRVIGILPHRGERAQFFNIQIPSSTLQQIFDPSPSFEHLQMAAEPGFALDLLRPLIMHYVAKLHRFDRTDTAAIDVADTQPIAKAKRFSQASIGSVYL